MDRESRAQTYHRWKRFGSVFETAFALLLLAGFVWVGGSVALREWVEAYGSNPWSVVAGYYFALALGWFLIFLPFRYLLGHRLERRFGLSRETVLQWMWEKVKALGVLLVLGGVCVEGLYYLIRETGDHWWWTAALCFVLFSAILTRLAPAVLLPIFFRFQPVADGELKERLVDLSRKADTEVLGVFEMDLSRKTKTANAALAGLGKSRRILLSDTLTRNFSVDEVETVIAHELGHHVFGHLWKMIGLQAFVVTAGFHLGHRWIGRLPSDLGYHGTSDVAGFPLLLLSLTAAGLVLSPLTNWVYRSFEWDCDRYAVRLTGKARVFAGALRKLAAFNLEEEEPSRWIEVLFHSHPSVGRRIRFAEQGETGRERV
jgi:STE24 endopeptidase